MKDSLLRPCSHGLAGPRLLRGLAGPKGRDCSDATGARRGEIRRQSARLLLRSISFHFITPSRLIGRKSLLINMLTNCHEMSVLRIYEIVHSTRRAVRPIDGIIRLDL